MTKKIGTYKENKLSSHTTSLFHYTNSWETIISILEKGIYFSYSYDNLKAMFLAVPMISFCDIPLSRNNEHTKRYGNYAIGISKNALLNKYPNGFWGPVNYVFNGSIVALSILAKELMSKHQTNLDEFIENRMENPIPFPDGFFTSEKGKVPYTINEYEPLNQLNHNIQSISKFISFSLGFVKPFNGINKNGEEQYNYDECEWRIILPERIKLNDETYLKWIYSEEDYKKWRGDKNTIKPHIAYEPFTFDIKHLKFIVVASENEIVNCVKDIMKMKMFCGKPITEDIKALLCSKLIAQENISTDF